jgi:hypothetical protein
MAKCEIVAGSTDQTIDVFIQDSSVTTGAGLTGLVYNTSNLVCYYRKGATGTPTALSLATQTVGGAHSDGGFVAVDGTNCPGQYRLDLSDTIIATAGRVTLYLKGATNMAPCLVEIEVVAVNKYDAVRGGMTSLPNANAEAAGGLYTRGTGAGQINQAANGMIDANVVRNAGTAITAASGRQEVNVSHFGGTAGTFSSGRPEVNATHWGGTAVASVVIDANLEQMKDEPITDEAAANWLTFFHSAGDSSTAKVTDLTVFIADVGSNGAGLTAIPWNAAWDAEVQSEAEDALVAKGLDHLVSASVTGTDITDNSIIAKMVSKSATADWDTFVNTTDSLEAIRDNGGGGGGGSMAWADLVADNDDVPGSFGKAIADILVDTGTSIPAAIEDIDASEAYQPRINRRPDPGFTIQVSRRADGTYKCPKPIRLTAGTVDGVYVFIDMSPLFGANNFVETVGDATFSAGSVEQGDDNGPRDTYAVLELTGTADEDCEGTVSVTMETGTTVDVVFDVEILGD